MLSFLSCVDQVGGRESPPLFLIYCSDEVWGDSDEFLSSVGRAAARIRWEHLSLEGFNASDLRGVIASTNRAFAGDIIRRTRPDR